MVVQGGSLGSFSSETYRLPHVCEEEDDATSGLVALKSEPDDRKVGDSVGFQEIIGIPADHCVSTEHPAELAIERQLDVCACLS
ncbi:transcription factor VOZ1-like [Actinidia eriantha]|uniref:transcription factor VOZ1-like n=1 Tax=Actinidia eriantha TaxID=165200 RepID=UPI002588F53A|nr:transcription factor VOZ1-like [Actinidia eriantha]